jgi:hypothetical protein
MGGREPKDELACGEATQVEVDAALAKAKD